MIWKLITLTAVLGGSLWLMGFGPDDLTQAADRVSADSAAATSPDSGDWG